MPDHVSVAASNGPRLRGMSIAQCVLDAFFVDTRLRLGIEPNPEHGGACLFLYGPAWPEAWRLPDGVTVADFNPYGEPYCDQGDAGFVDLLRALAPHLAEALTVQAVAHVKCRFPLAACEWHVEPGGKDARVNGFAYGLDRPVVLPPARESANSSPSQNEALLRNTH